MMFDVLIGKPTSCHVVPLSTVLDKKINYITYLFFSELISNYILRGLEINNIFSVTHHMLATPPCSCQ